MLVMLQVGIGSDYINSKVIRRIRGKTLLVDENNLHCINYTRYEDDSYLALYLFNGKQSSCIAEGVSFMANRIVLGGEEAYY